jgi:hypothetical protein
VRSVIPAPPEDEALIAASPPAAIPGRRILMIRRSDRGQKSAYPGLEESRGYSGLKGAPCCLFASSAQGSLRKAANRQFATKADLQQTPANGRESDSIFIRLEPVIA